LIAPLKEGRKIRGEKELQRKEKEKVCDRKGDQLYGIGENANKVAS